MHQRCGFRLLREENELPGSRTLCSGMDADEQEMLHVQVIGRISQIYLLYGRFGPPVKRTPPGWSLNITKPAECSSIAQEESHKVYWPNGIAVFGPTSPKQNCPSKTIIRPTTVYGISKYAGEFWCHYFHQRAMAWMYAACVTRADQLQK